MQRPRSPGGYPPFPPLPPGMFWRLNGKIAVPVSDMIEFMLYNETITSRVGEDQIGPFHVSTVFLGLAHNVTAHGDPMLFETMVFADNDCEHDVYCRRYFTWGDAEKGHGEACEWAQRQIEEINEQIKLGADTGQDDPSEDPGFGNANRYGDKLGQSSG